MTQENYNDICKALAEAMPFKWRLQSANAYSANLVAYVDARQVQQRLDDVLGMNWSVEYIDRGNSLFARIGIRLPDGEWIYREDLGTESNTEKEKGEVSDSFKRAAVAFGVGRFLYSLGVIRTDSGKGKNGKDAPFIDKNDPKTSLEYADDLNAYANYFIAENGDKQKAKAMFMQYKQAGGSFNADNKAKAQNAAVTTLNAQADKKSAQQAKPAQQTTQPKDDLAALRKRFTELKEKLIAFKEDEDNINAVVAAHKADPAKMVEMLEKAYLVRCINDAYMEDFPKDNPELIEKAMDKFKNILGSDLYSLKLEASNPALKPSVETLKKLLADIQQMSA